MKCPKCHKDMVRKDAGNHVYYYECPHCGRAIGKPEEVKTAEKQSL